MIDQMQKTQTIRKPRHRNRPHRRAVAAVRKQVSESDGTYFLKLVIIVILGTLWLKLAQPVMWQGVPFGGFPLGMLLALAGILLLEKSQTNRKIWYAVLIIVTIVSYFLPAGIVI